jgi:alpha-tubulin suppressor-like RCC1 family protein
MGPRFRQSALGLFWLLSCLLLATWGAAPAAAEAPNLAATFQEYARRDASLEVLGSGDRAVDPLSMTSPTRPWRAGAIPPDLTAAQESAGAVDAAPAQLDAVEALNFTAVAAGIYYTCGLTASGGVKCWGRNEYGQLGDGTTTTRSAPVDVVGLASGVSAITAGSSHTCALMAGGGVKCWGYNGYGQLGDGTMANHSMPVDVVGLASVATAIDAGSSHTCARLVDGKAMCWGNNQYGQLGDGTTDPHSTPGDVVGLSNVTAITAGGWHTCGLTADGGARCWGYNSHGQVGDDTTDQRTLPVGVAGLASGVTAITAGRYHTCALIQGGGVKCWGYNSDGQLGDGTSDKRTAPVDVMGLPTGVTAIVAGGYHTCGLAAGGSATCWGYNAYGQLGDGTITDRHAPTGVSGLASGVTAITGNSYHTCAVVSGGGARCWGYNSYGQLGDGTAVQRAMPTDVYGLTSVTAIAAGFAHTCALLSGGAAKCWGSNGNGQVGDGTNWARGAPRDVLGLTSGVTAIAAGGSHNCVILAGGGVKCWGANYNGQLGDATTTDRWEPADVPGLSGGVMAIAAGTSHTCAALAGGGVKCWGYNGYGQLGDGTTEQRTSPVPVSGLTDTVTAIAAGWGHTCALLSDGGVQCWGYNYSGQLGDGTTEQHSTPAPVPGLSGVIAIAAGDYHTCALGSSGPVKCWGANERGQLGDATWQNKSTPVEPIGMAEGVTGIAAGGFHTCASASAGTAKCWGYNGSGQLGDGTTVVRSTPSDVAGLASGGSGIAAGEDHTCVLVGAGRPKCWGLDALGQLGAGRILHQTTPVDVVEAAPIYLTINYPNGRSGSIFTATGWNFPPGAPAAISINGQTIATDLAVNATGGFIFFLDTDSADPGVYSVTVSANPSATTGFVLADEAPLRPQEGGGQVFLLPGGIGLREMVYLPLATR